MRKEQVWVKNAHEAVGEGFPLYLDLQQHTDPMVRMSAAYILACFQEYATRSRPVLLSSLGGENDLSAKAGYLLSLSAHSEHDAPLLDLLMEMAIGSEPRLVRVIAAILLAQFTGSNPSTDIVQVLLDALAYPTDIQDGYAEFPWSQTDIVGDICKVLCTFEPNSIASLAIPVLLDIFNAIGQVNARRLQQKEVELRQANANNPHQPPEPVIKMTATTKNVSLIGMLDIVRALLHFAFQEQVVEDPQALTAVQRTMLKTIVTNDVA